MGVMKLLAGLWTWNLISLDKVPPTEISGQFIPESMSEEYGTEWDGDFAAGREDEVLQWAGGASKRITFRARFWREHIFDDIMTKVRDVKSLVERDYLLGRPPVVLFTLGVDISQQCVVESVGGINYDSPDYTGSIKGVSFEITLRKYTEFSLTATDPTAAVPESRVYWAKKGDTFEQIALREYGDAKFGPYLRYRNYAAGDDFEVHYGQRVHVIPKKKVIKTPVETYSIPLSQGEATTGRRQQILDRHRALFIAHSIFGDL